MVWYIMFKSSDIVLINIATQFKNELSFEDKYLNQRNKIQIYNDSTENYHVPNLIQHQQQRQVGKVKNIQKYQRSNGKSL